jgi:uncharacterized protein
MSDYDDLIKIADLHSEANDKKVAKLVISNNNIVGGNNIEGIDVKTDATEEQVNINIIVKKGYVIEKPVHMCFGILKKEFNQKIKLYIKIEDNAEVSIVGHCVFPNAIKVKHFMDAKINVGKNSKYSYFEKHIHSDTGGVEVYPRAGVDVGKNSRFNTEFELLKGRVGLIDINYNVEGGENSVIDIVSRISGYAEDIIKIKESANLKGEYSRGVLRSRVAVRDDAKAEVYNKIIASGAHARGHVDCTEILQGNGIVKAYPDVEVLHPKARITHEAKLGGIENKQLETLMARGLTEKEAEEIIIRGLLS